MIIKHFSELPDSDPSLKAYLNYNPPHKEYTLKQNKKGITSRDPEETDRGGWRGYDRVYSFYLQHLKDDKLNLLEIGVEKGYGLLAWASYFYNSRIFGVEKNTKYLPFYDYIQKKYLAASRISFNFHDSTQPPKWSDTYFDIIIDDGSHLPEDQVNTFVMYWPLLKPGGFYFIEDISTRYTNPSMNIVFDKLMECALEGNAVSVYSHTNSGWMEILENETLRKVYKVKEGTPFIAEDYIAVIKKK